MTFTLSSPAFQAGGDIPRRFTCDGEDVSPALQWDGAPADAAAMALLVDDPDARGFSHWVVIDIPGSPSGGLAEDASTAPDAPTEGVNDFRRTGWGGPCPPSGTHRYRFTLYALDTPLRLSGAPAAAQVRAASEGHVLATAELVASYTRSR